MENKESRMRLRAVPSSHLPKYKKGSFKATIEILMNVVMTIVIKTLGARGPANSIYFWGLLSRNIQKNNQQLQLPDEFWA